MMMGIKWIKILVYLFIISSCSQKIHVDYYTVELNNRNRLKVYHYDNDTVLINNTTCNTFGLYTKENNALNEPYYKNLIPGFPIIRIDTIIKSNQISMNFTDSSGSLISDTKLICLLNNERIFFYDGLYPTSFESSFDNILIKDLNFYINDSKAILKAHDFKTFNNDDSISLTYSDQQHPIKIGGINLLYGDIYFDQNNLFFDTLIRKEKYIYSSSEIVRRNKFNDFHFHNYLYLERKLYPLIVRD
jgi:hypothetical protein